MLTIYSTPGSPGASTLAMHLAAYWASIGREILLIEADPAGGSISRNLGIQFTPGTASFVAADQPARSNHLIDHSQDVLFASLHVMPAPATPTGARGIFEVLCTCAEDLRRIAENEMAVIIDGGRLSAEMAASELTTAAAATVVVCRDNSQLSTIQNLTDSLASGADDDATAGYAVTVGKSPISDEEWQQSHGLTFAGSVETIPDIGTDNLSVFLSRTKRKNKKWLTSLEQVAETLYPYAQPPMSNRSRLVGTEVADDGSQQTPAQTEPVAGEPAGYDPALLGEAPPMVPDERSAPYQAPAQVQPSPESPYGQPQSHYLPPTDSDWHSYPPPPVQPYEQPPAQPYQQPHAQPYEQPPAQPYQQPPAQPYEQPPAQPHQQPPAQPYEQPPQQPPAQPYEQQPPTAPPPPAQPHQPPLAHTYPQPHAQPYEQPPQQPPAQPYEQPPGHTYPQPPPPQEPPAAETHRTSESASMQHREPESAPAPAIAPTGSFRDWATKLHGLDANDAAARPGG